MIKIVPSKLDNLNPSSMKWTSTLPEYLKRSIGIFIILLVITLINFKSYSQTRTYANSITVGTDASDHVDNAGNSILVDNSFARVKSRAGTLLGGPAYVGVLELKFPQSVEAGKTAYIRINSSTADLLNTLLGGSIGKLVADLGNTLLLGNHTFEVGAKMGSNTIVSQNSTTGFPNTNIKIIKDASGFFYIAITPDKQYDRVYIKDISDVVIPLLPSSGYTDVYYAFTATDVDECSQAFATSFDASGLNLDLLGLGKAGVTNMEYAIDADQTNFSQLSLGVIAVAGAISQDIYFGNPSAATDDYNVRIKVDPALLNLGLLNNISVTAYSGLTQVGTPQNLSSLISLDLLGLLNNGNIVSIPVSPGGAFDHVRVTVTSLLNVNLPQSINLYSVIRSAGRPLPTLATVNACAGTVASLTATTNSANELRWYDSPTGGTLLATVAYNAAFTPTATVTKTYYVAAKKLNCSQESGRMPVNVVVTAIPGAPTAATVAPICAGGSAVLSVNNPVAGNIYRWYTADGTLLSTGNTYTTTLLNTTTTFYVEAVTGTCVSTTRTVVPVTVNPLPALASVTTNNESISSGQTAKLNATSDAGTTIKWYAAGTGGSPLGTGNDFVTPQLTTTTIYYVEAVSTSGCASATRVPVTVTVTNAPVNPNCNAAVSQQSGITGICLACSIETPAGSIDADPNTFTKINLAVGIGATGYQRLLFSNPGSSTDSIRLDLEIPNDLVDINVLGGITVKVMNGSTLVTSYSLNSSLLNIKLLSGKRFKATMLAGGVYDRVEISMSSLVSALTNLSIYGAEVIYPNPTVAPAGLSACYGATSTLTAVANGGTTLKWFANATGGTALETGETYTTGILNSTKTYYIEVSKGTCANAQRVPVTVTVNPQIVFVSTTLNNATAASTYVKQITVATGGTPAFTYTLAPGNKLPDGLTLSPSGLISGTALASENATFSIIAQDSKGCTATAAYSLTVTPALGLPGTALPNGTVGVVYPTKVIPPATGGTAPFTYTATNLPPGLDFNPTTREITGTPSKSGTYVIPVTATDANGNSITTNYTIIVRDPLVLAAVPLVDGTVGKVYPTQIIPAATGGFGQFTYSATGLPPGLDFNPLTREITGTPSQSGTYTIPVKVTDGDNNTITTNFSIKVVNPLVLATKPLAEGTVGTVYTPETIPAATGGTGSYTYVANNLPPGLTFNAATRQIIGTPTQSGIFNVNVTVTDGANPPVTQSYSLKVNGVLTLPTAALPNGTVGRVYTAQPLPVVTGGTNPITYVVTGLPAGITYDAVNHQIKGTPTIGGTFNFTLKATDNAGLTTSTDYALLINVDAPQVASTTTCSGTSVTLSITNVIPGVTYKWYAATGSTSIFTGSVYITDLLTSNTTYNVEAVSGTAVSSRTPVTVTVNAPATLATIVTNKETISSGQTADLKATADAGNTIKWYAAATGGAALATGETFTTPKLNITTTYYVETQNSIGCLSAMRVPVTVIVTTGPVNPNCNAAVAQQSGIGGLLCLICGVQTPDGSTDADPNTFTKINLVAGVGATGYQRLIFANPGTGTDSIRLDLEIPVGLADLGILGGATVRVMNGGTIVSTYPLNSSLLSVRLLSGNRFKATLLAGGTYDRVEISFGGLLSALTSMNIYGAEIIYPNPTVASTGLTVCSGSATTLNAVANGGTTLKWYASINSGTVLATGPSYTTDALNTTTIYYIEVSKGGCANVQRVPVTVTVTNTPANPSVAAVAPICSGSAAVIKVNNPVSGIVYNWYADVFGGIPLASGTTFTTPVLNAGKTYYVEAASGTCVSALRVSVAVTVNSLPNVATITTNNANISSGQTATLSAIADAGLTINWYGAPSGGLVLGTGTLFTTSPLTVTNTYYVETVNASGCSSATRVPVTVTVTGGPANPNCNAANSQQSDIEGICLLCSIQDAGNSVDANLTNYTTISLPVGVGGSGYQRLIFPGTGVSTDSIRLNLETPTGLADLTVLGGIKVNIMNGTTIVNSFTLSNSLLNLRLLSGNRFVATLPAGGTYDRVEIRALGLISALVNLRIYGAEVIYPNPTVSATGQTICAGNTTNLSAAANGGTTLRWYGAANGGLPLATGENFTTPALTVNTIYYIEVSKGTCSNQVRVPVEVKVTTAPNAPVVAAVSPVCSGSSTSIPVSNALAGVTYNWYADALGGTPLFSGPVFTTPILTTGTIYYVEAATGSCSSATRTAVNVNVNPLPVLPQIQASATTVNPGQTAILTASSSDSDVIFNWYTSTVSTTPVYSGPTYVTPPLTINTTYYLGATSTVTGCASASRVQVTINVNGGGSPNPVPCEAATSEVHGVTGLAVLADVFNPELAIDNDTKTGSSLVMPIGLLGASVYQRVGFSNLSNIGDTVRVMLSAPGKLLSLGLLSDIRIGTYNNGTSNNDNLAINNALIHLELLSGNTEALISFVPTQQFNQVQVSINDGLAGLLKTLDLNYVQRVAVAPQVVSANVTACETQTTVLSVKDPNVGIVYKWYSATGNLLGDGVNFTTPALTTSTKFYVEANTTSGCQSYRTLVNVDVTPKPQPPVLVSATVSACSNTDVNLEVSNPIIGITYKWYNSAGVYQADGVTFKVLSVSGALPIIYSVEAVNSCGVASAKVGATINVGVIDKPVVTPASVTVRSGSPAVLTATSSSVGATFKWYATPASVTELSTNARYETIPLINNAVTPSVVKYYVEASVSGGCTSVRTEVEVTVLPSNNPIDVPCEAALRQVRDGVDGIALITGVFNPASAADNNAESASSLVMPVGILGASVYQHVGFNGMSYVGDTIRVRISSPGKLLSLAVLPSIELTTYKGLISNNDAMVVSNPLIHLELFSDNSGAIISFVPQKEFDGVELRLKSGLASVLNTLDFNYAQRVLAAPTVLSTTATACAGSAATLSVKNPIAGVTYKWYRGNAYVADGITLSTDLALAADTYDYFVSANGHGCESAKTKVVVTILAAPDAPVAATGNPVTTCPNTPVVLSVNAVGGVSFNWYDLPAGGNLLATNTNTYTTATTLGVGVFNIYVEAVNGNSCTNTTARTKITLTVNPTSLASDITVTGVTAPFCAGSTVKLTAASITVNLPVFTWYNDAGLTDVAHTGFEFTTPPLTSTKAYYVTVSGTNKCANTAADARVVTLIVNPPATAADLDVTGAELPFCAGTTATLTANTSTIINPIYTWYSDPALTDAVFTGKIFTTPPLSINRTYYVTVSGDNKCANLAGNTEVVALTVNPPSLASDINVTGAELPFCAGAKANLVASTNTVTNPVFTWYSNPALTDVVANTAAFTTPNLTVTTTYYVTVSGLNRCENTAATAKIVTLTVNPPALASDINVSGAGLPFCAGTSAILTANSVTVDSPVFTWYSDPALTNAVSTGAVFNSGPLTVTTTYYVTVRGANKCENAASTGKAVTLVVNPPATAADINVDGNNSALCAGNSVTLTASSTTVNGPIFTWYKNPALTDVAFSGSVFIAPPVTITTNYYVTVRGSNKCENTAATAKVITLTVNPPANASDIVISGADPLCAGNSVNLVASSSTVNLPVFTWYTDPALTNAIYTGTTLNTGILTVNTTYYVTVRGTNKCPNTPATARIVTITVNPLPNAPVIAAAGLNICSGETTMLTVQNAQIGVNYQWYNVAVGGVPFFTGTQLTTGILNTSTDYYVLATSASGCGNATGRVKVTVVVSPKPDVPNVTLTTVNVCIGNTGVLSVSNPQAGITYKWYNVAVGGTELASGPDFTTPVINANTTFYVGASTATCVSTSRKAVNVTASALPVAPATVAGAANPLCSGTSTVLSVNNPDPSFTYKWYTTAAGGTAIAEGNTFTTPTLTTTTTYYVGAVNTLTSCISTSRTAVVVTVLSKLASPVVSTQEITATSITFQWNAVPGATAYEVSLDNGLTWVAPTSGANGTTYLVAGLKPDQKVTIRVRAKGQLDCQLSDATTFTATSDNPLGNSIFVPNTFTPNNDGKNDVLYVYGNTIAKMKLRIYNQWGQFIYESLNIQNGWDGTYKGEMQPNGVYVYSLDAEFNDGTKTTKKGTITLLR